MILHFFNENEIYSILTSVTNKNLNISNNEPHLILTDKIKYD